MAIVAEDARGRTFLSPSDDHEANAQTTRPDLEPSEINHWPGRTNVVEYGMTDFGDLFTDRQLSALTTFSDLVGEARALALEDAQIAFAGQDRLNDNAGLADGGRGPQAYADAVATYLAFTVDRMAEYGSTIASWLPKDNAIRSTFGRQAIPMVWDYCEANFFAKSSAASDTCVDVVASALERTPAIGSGQIDQLNASSNGYPVRPIAISTDPPYYDNIGYAGLSDYFYFWLRRSLSAVWPILFRRLQTPKAGELVATPYRALDRSEMASRTGSDDHPVLVGWDLLSPKDRAEREFMFGMSQALNAMRNASNTETPLAIYYAFKQSEKSADGVSSAGWASFLQAVIDSGLLVDGTWPMRTESEERLIGNNSNALASSIVLVCRQRPETAHTVSRRDFLAELRRELPEAIARMRAAGIHPVDIPQAALGPGMKVFSQYAAVREADDSAMPVGRAITLINQVRGEIDHADSGDLDAATRFALDWFASYGWNAHDSGTAIQLAQSYDLTERALREAGVLVTDRGEARLMRRSEMAADWRPSRDRNLTTWELAQALHRALNEGGGVAETGALLAEARELTGSARWLIARLFALAEDRRMVDEARGWGYLSEAWAEVETAADRSHLAETAALNRAVSGDLF